MYRSAWHGGLKTTYYLRSLGASNIEKATVNVKKEVRGAAGETKAETATRDAGVAATAAAAALSPVERANAPLTVSATPFTTSASAPTSVDAPRHSPTGDGGPAPKKVYSAEEKRVCSIEAMKNGEECEACQ
jgi:ribonucleoside-diphosphate reductase alpha chain